METLVKISDIDGLLEKVRNRFAHVDACPITGERVFFENAGGALTLKAVVDTSARFAAIPDNQARDNPASKHLSNIIEKARKDVMTLFGTDSGYVFVGESGTELIYRLISAAVLASEKGVVLGSTLEHPATRSACQQWATQADIDHLLATHNNESGIVTVDDYRPHLDNEVRVATIVHTSPVTGMGVDIVAIADAIRQSSPEAIIIVDGIQHASHGLIDLKAADIDGYVISPYKVFSRHGYGVAWVSDRLRSIAHNGLVGGDPGNWELGTRDTGSYATISDVVDYFEWLGRHFTKSDNRRQRIEAAGHAIHHQEKELTDAMLFGTGNQKGLSEMPGVNIIGGTENPAREGLVSLWVDEVDSTEVVSRLNDAGIRVHIRIDDRYSGNILKPLGLKNCVRVSMCHYNSKKEVAQFLSTMSEITGLS